VFWTGGSHGFGHVAISLGNGKIASSDILRTGKVDVVPLSMIQQKWGLHYAGWAPPYRQASWGVNPHTP
jgi:cell wall-associated NlpC family hydrolase